ncbi:peptidyl-prolyl cis-trans isomerase G-like [Pecten maximus]|uniref:peptidyl-prolyl cis-trans isomerase G-like n=1 Tax=Pecten maximus TaxID=6579 RepID=UPI001457F564|nr:peptidyl-prolyl cis-trans isomerase G-like [Pecten maximus]
MAAEANVIYKCADCGICFAIKSTFDAHKCTDTSSSSERLTMPRRRYWKKSIVKVQPVLQTDVTEDTGLIQNSIRDIDMTEDTGLIQNSIRDLTSDLTEDTGLAKSDRKKPPMEKQEMLHKNAPDKRKKRKIPTAKLRYSCQKPNNGKRKCFWFASSEWKKRPFDLHNYSKVQKELSANKMKEIGDQHCFREQESSCKDEKNEQRKIYNRNYKRMQRSDKYFKLKEAQKRTKTRAENDFRSNERTKEMYCKRKARFDDAYKHKEKLQEKESKKKARLDDQFRSKEKIWEKQTKTKTRSDDDYRFKEKLKERECKKRARLDDEYRSKEKNWEKQTKTKTRSDDDYRTKEKLKERECKKRARLDDEYRSKEKI